MTGKQIKDVFPGLRFSNDINDLISQSEVTGITMFEKEKKMVISILSNNLIPKKMIYKAENEISDFVFANKQVICIIDEHFNLSSQYKLRQLTEEYKESFLLEVKNESYVSYRLLSRGEWFCNDDNVLTLALENTGLARNHSRAIKEYLERTYKDRFGMEIKVGFDYTEEQKTSLRTANELRLKYELKNIEELNESKRPKQKTEPEKARTTGNDDVNDSKNNSKDKASDSSENRKKSDTKAKDNQGAKGNFDKFSKGKYGKNSDSKYDENVIYGRNCEGDTISISELYDGVGVVCIKGQVITLEDRELKSGKFIINGTITDFTDTITLPLASLSVTDPFPSLKEGIRWLSRI